MRISDWSSDVCSSDLDKVRMKFALQLGASARERLKAAAAARWGVPVSEVIANDSVLIHQASDRKLRYGDVVTDAAKLTLRSDEHTSELQSLMRNSYAVFCLKKQDTQTERKEQIVN